MFNAPKFWYQHPGLTAQSLSPLSSLYSLGSSLRGALASSQKVTVPVLCIGNLVVGGAGKTPTALSIATIIKSQGKNVHFLTRGYGGRVTSPTLVDFSKHTAVEVGDEALLLANVAPTWVARNRVAGAKAAVQDGAEVIIMDDGLQNPYLEKDLALLVIDGQQGLGNGKVLPAGPLREPIVWGLQRVQAVVLIGEDQRQVTELVKRANKPLLTATVIPENESVKLIKGQSVIAFAGIGFPEKFFAMLEKYGARVLEHHSFQDHYAYRENDLSELVHRANKRGALVITTAKDKVRVPKGLHSSIQVFNIQVKFDDQDVLEKIIQQAI